MCFLSKGFDIELSIDYKEKYYLSLLKIDFNNSVAIISYKDFPFILKNENLQIVAPLGNLELFIITKEPFYKIKSLANVSYPVKILLNAISKKIRVVNGGMEAFLSGKADGYVSESKVDGYYNYPLDFFGIRFNKFYLVGDKDFLKAHKMDIEFLSCYLKDKLKGDMSRAVEEVIFGSYVLGRKIDLCRKFFKRCDEKFNKTKIIKIAITPNWPPFHFLEDGYLRGISVDFWKLIAKRGGIDYKFYIKPFWGSVLNSIKDKESDLTLDSSFTKNRAKYAIFTKPYMKFPLGIFCKKVVDSIEEIKSIAVGYNFTAYKMMKEHYPNIKYILTKDTPEALEYVKTGQAECAVDILPVMSWYLKEMGLNDKSLILTPFYFELQIMLRKGLEDLRDRLNVLIDEISKKNKKALVEKYVFIRVYTTKSNKYLNFLYALFFVVFFYLLIQLKNYKQKASFDALTGILNRGTIEEKLREIAREKEGSVIFFDIDHFKKINDTYGHEFGDYVLKKLSKIIKGRLRRKDFFGRWGGEEFLIVLPNTPYNGALKLAEEIRELIEKANFENVKVTISLGVGDFKRGEDVDTIIQRVDNALYNAKNSGRNQVKGIYD
ncbi:MAG: diguanylate cyclase [Nautiliaceae bacterium]